MNHGAGGQTSGKAISGLELASRFTYSPRMNSKSWQRSTRSYGLRKAAGNLFMDEGRPDTRYKAWMAQARYDMDAAEANALQGRHALACFLSHQAAEKAVTGFLYASGCEQVWGHALADLCEDALAFDPSFDLIKSVAMLLDKHFLGTRYPSALPGGVPAEAHDETDSTRAMAIAREVLKAVAERIGHEKT